MKDRSKLISITTTCAVLVVLVCVGLYYLQNNRMDLPYIKAFGYLVATVSSLFALIFLKKEEGRRELALGSFAFSALMLVSGILAIIPKASGIADLTSHLAMAFFVPFALCYVGKLATGKDVFEKVLVKAIILAVSVLVVIILGFIYSPWVWTAYKVLFALWVIILIAGAVFAVINLIKKREAFINWSYLFFVLSCAAVYVQSVINTAKFTRTLEAIALLAVSFLVVALVCKEEVKTNKR